MNKLIKFLYVFAFCLGGFFAYSSSVFAFVSSDIVSYYPFDNSYTDPNNIGLALSPYVSFQATTVIGKYGNAYNIGNSFVGSGSPYNGQCLTTSTSYPNVNSSFTISFWHKRNDLTYNAGNEQVFTSNAGKNMGVSFASGGYAFFQFYDTAWQTLGIASLVPADTNWHNYIFVGTFGNLNPTFKVYRDGTIFYTHSGGDAGIPAYDASNRVLHLFCHGFNYQANNGLRGSLDDFAIFNKIITNDEILALQIYSVKDVLIPPVVNPESDYIQFFNSSYTKAGNSSLSINYDIKDDEVTKYSYQIFNSTGDVVYTKSLDTIYINPLNNQASFIVDYSTIGEYTIKFSAYNTGGARLGAILELGLSIVSAYELPPNITEDEFGNITIAIPTVADPTTCPPFTSTGFFGFPDNFFVVFKCWFVHLFTEIIGPFFVDLSNAIEVSKDQMLDKLGSIFLMGFNTAKQIFPFNLIDKLSNSWDIAMNAYDSSTNENANLLIPFKKVTTSGVVTSSNVSVSVLDKSLMTGFFGATVMNKFLWFGNIIISGLLALYLYTYIKRFLNKAVN